MRQPVAALLAALLLTAGCGGTTTRVVDLAALERSIAADLERQSGERPRVRCPEGTEVRATARLRCTLVLADGGAAAARVTLLDDDGGFRYELVRGGPAR